MVVLLVSAMAAVWHAAWALHAGRYFDEQFQVRNLRVRMEGGSVPENAYYPSLSFLSAYAVIESCNHVASWVGHPGLVTLDDDGVLNRAGYLLARLLSVLFGLLAIVVTYAIGTRCFEPWIGLLAAIILATMPMHVDLSAMFKPETLLLLTTLLATWTALRALELKNLKSYLIAGVAAGLALATKYNGGPAAFALVVVAVLQVRRRRSVVVWLLAAGAVAALVFLALNPWVITHPELYHRAFKVQSSHYRMMGAQRSRNSAWAQLLFLPEFVLSEYGLGALIGSICLLGVIGWIVVCARDRLASLRSRRLLVLLGFMVGYVVLYVRTSEGNLISHNWYVLIPYLALAGSWLLTLTWRLMSPRLRLSGRRAVRVGAALVVIALCAGRGGSTVYRLRVPTTVEAGTKWVVGRLPQVGGRLMGIEVTPDWESLLSRGGRLGVVRTERLAAMPAAERSRLDALLFANQRLHGDTPVPYLRMVERRPGRLRKRFSPQLFKLRGPALFAVVHQWELAGSGPVSFTASEDRRIWMGDLSGPEDGQLLSLDLCFRGHMADRGNASATFGGREVKLVPLMASRHGYCLRTERFTGPSGGSLHLAIPEPWETPSKLQAYEYRWSTPGGDS